MKHSDNDYFKQATSWADDIYTHTLVSRNRYQVAFMSSFALIALLVIALSVVSFKQHTSLVVVHQNEAGFTYVTLDEQKHAPNASRAEIEADIVRYITARESYHPATYQTQSSLVSLLSDNLVASEFSASQSTEHPNAPVHLLGNKGYRKVSVNSILFLDNEDENNPEQKAIHKNVAQVNFEVSDYLFGRDQHIDTPFVVLVSWGYRGTPTDPEKMWQNWRGFMMTTYKVSAVNVHSMKEG